MHRLLERAIAYSGLALGGATIARSNAAIVTPLQDGKQFTREALAKALALACIASDGLHRSFLIQRTQVDSLICYATPRGKQATFALIEEWVSPAPLLERDKALATFARRYFTSHSPAAVHDFAF